MKVLIIGGTGQISSGIVKSLKQRKAQITVFNRGKTDDRLGDGVEHLNGDRNDFKAFESAMASSTWDAVIDMICFGKEQAESGVRAFGGRTGQFIVAWCARAGLIPAGSDPVQWIRARRKCCLETREQTDCAKRWMNKYRLK